MELGEMQENYNFETIENGRRVELKIHVPILIHRQIIGSKGNNRRRLEMETKTQVIIPKIGDQCTVIGN